MSKAYECDRCGELQSGSPALEYRVHQVGQLVTLPKIMYPQGDFEVCNECVDHLTEALAEGLAVPDDE